MKYKNQELSENRIFQKLLFFIVIAISFLNINCNKDENPVVPPVEPSITDSNFFNWQYIEINGVNIGGTMFVADTNKVFIVADICLLLYDNGVFHNIDYKDPDFFSNSIYGLDANNVFIGGGSLSTRSSKLKKWNGTNIIDIPIPIDSSIRILKIIPVSENELWISTSSNIIYHYINSNFTTYRLNDSYISNQLSFENSNTLYSFALKRYTDNYYTNNVYEFRNDNWIKIYSDSITPFTELSYVIIGECNDKILRSGKTGIYTFSGTNWVKQISMYGEAIPETAGGNSFNNLLVSGNTVFNNSDDWGRKIYYYDGKKLYRQKNHVFQEDQGVVGSIYYKFGRFYLSYFGDLFHYYFSIATPKN